MDPLAHFQAGLLSRWLARPWRCALRRPGLPGLWGWAGGWAGAGLADSRWYHVVVNLHYDTADNPGALPLGGNLKLESFLI